MIEPCRWSDKLQKELYESRYEWIRGFIYQTVTYLGS